LWVICRGKPRNRYTGRKPVGPLLTKQEKKKKIPAEWQGEEKKVG